MVNSDVSPLMNDSRRIIASANKQGPILFRLNDVQRKRDGRGQERRGRLFPLLAFLAIQEKKLTIFDSNGARGRKGSDNEGVVTKDDDKGWWSDREDTEFFCRFYHERCFWRSKVLVQGFLELLWKWEGGKKGEKKFWEDLC